MASDEDWLVRSRSFSRENDLSSVFTEDGRFCVDYLTPQSPNSPQSPNLPQSPNSPQAAHTKVSTLDMELNKLASLKKHPPPRAVSVEDFVTLYGLPKTGKNPHNLKIPLDLAETDLVDVLGTAKGIKGRSGYSYSECKDKDILSRIQEIFPLVYLRDLPKSKVIAKKFARGIVLEKRKKKPFSWAEFAGTSNRNQRSKWLKKVELCLRSIAKLTHSNSKEIYKAKGIDDLLHDPDTKLWKSPQRFEGKRYTQVQDVPECTEESLKELGDLMRLLKLVGLQLFASTQDYESVGLERAQLSTKALEEEGVLRRTKTKVQKLRTDGLEVSSNKNEAYAEMIEEAVLDYEAVLLELKLCNSRYELLGHTQVCLKRQFEALLIQITRLRRGKTEFCLKPRPLFSQFDSSNVSRLNTIPLSPCALCLSGFPLNDIIVCTCGHLYHPWCAGIWFKVSAKCVEKFCDATVHPLWFNSFGFGKLHFALEEFGQSLELDDEKDKLLDRLTSTILKSHPNIDPEEVYREQLKESKMCTETPTIAFTGTEALLSASETVVSQSLGNGSAAGSDQGRDESEHLVLPVPNSLHPEFSVLPSLPTIDEVDSPEKNEDHVMPSMVGIEAVELQERIRKLKEEDADFERLQKLREEAASLEERRKLREGVRKVPQPPPLTPIDSENTELSKRKTRNMTAEETAKEVKKKPKKSKRNQRITPLG